MIIFNNRIFFTIVIWFTFHVALSQNKSTNIQTINGVSYYVHIIEKGQSLYSISKLYNVSLDEIYSVNPEVKAGAKASQEIKIPVKKNASADTKTVSPKPIATTPATAITNATTSAVVAVHSPSAEIKSEPIDTNLYYVYKVSKKETFYSVSKKFKLTESELKIFNPSLINQGLKEGQIIIVGEKPVKPTVKTIPVKSKADSINENLIHKPKKPSYNVALILPFKLEQTLALDLSTLIKSNSSFPAVSGLAVDFYLGFKSLVDSITSKDFEVNIDLYDIDDKDSLKLAQTVNDPKFKQTDFIFGPLHANGFKSISQKAKELGVPIVSPVTQQNKILYNNHYVSKTNPSQFTLLESLADYCIDSLIINDANIMLMSAFGKDAKDESYIKAFKKYYNEKQKALGKTVKDTIWVVKGLAGVKSAYKPNVKNVVVMLNTNQVFISDFTTQLAIFADKKDFVLCGWQSTGSIDNLDQEYLNQLHFTFPCQNNITNTSAYNALAAKYKSQQNVYPSEFFFIGFDIANYYLKNLRDNGPDFIYGLNNLPAETDYMRFKFARPDNQTGFDNRGVYIFRYTDYQLYKTGWK